MDALSRLSRFLELSNATTRRKNALKREYDGALEEEGQTEESAAEFTLSWLTTSELRELSSILERKDT